MIDLRSDTLTMPGAAMLMTVLTAELGDDGRAGEDGRGEDRAANALEDHAAALMGKEAAVLFPSGTMANTAALLTWAGPGDAVLAEPLLHAVKAEKAAFSDRLGRLKAVAYRVTPQGKPDLDSARELLAQNTIKVLLLENTHNFRGGVCLDAGETDALCAAAHDRGVPVHLDGARIFNAAARTGEPAARLCRGTDSVMFCLSKGLGAPAGSLVAGDKAFIGALRETRKLLGGTMRQAGVIAAPGL
ncbi:MAG TPA: threonine aldolase family protein, partial [Candidatus Limnocylindria bacterium]|nr:threonine aldolase family protein [Candidatus Limnocylindria bacterium]